MPSSPSVLLGIASVERETGISKDTLRVWERRYGFPHPERDNAGERVYPPEQMEKLRLIKSLMDRGYRPGKLVTAEIDTLRALAGPGNPSDAASDGLAHFIALCKAQRIEALRQELAQRLMRMGLQAFVMHLAAPLTVRIGTAWASGELAVFEEHLYTESLQAVLRQAISAIPPAAPRPRILLTTIPRESHALGLLMAEAILALEGACCVSLGTQTPIGEIALAAQAQRADIVALSFSSSVPSGHALQALTDLRAALPPATDIWTGGSCPVLVRRPPTGILHLDLHSIPSALTQWRRERMPGSDLLSSPD